MNKEEYVERLIFTATVITFIVILVVLFRGAAVSYLKEGMGIPSFSIYSMDGQSLSYDDFRGRVLLVNFWASWCKPCIDEFPSLIRMKERYAGEDMDIMMVNVGETAEEIKKFLDEHGFEVAVYRDPGAKMSKAFGTYKYPETYVIDRGGVLRKKVIGQLNWMEDTIQSYVNGLLKEK